MNNIHIGKTAEYKGQRNVDNPDKAEPQVPRTNEARILSAGVDRMPEADRKRILKMVELMFEQYKDYFEGNDDN